MARRSSAGGSAAQAAAPLPRATSLREQRPRKRAAIPPLPPFPPPREAGGVPLPREAGGVPPSAGVGGGWGSELVIAVYKGGSDQR